ncbi:MAG: HAD-IA family hydrolase [Alphaproteobacteria bacterium]|nr:HAD-IA family hydrolase [Rhodospirillales bacterium]MCW9045951.1 HAD-IA family hydrolase [Alphaproteobacteria bacterium]
MFDNEPLRLAIFDLDGTIVDSQNVIVAGMHQAGKVHGEKLPLAHDVKRVVGLPLRTAVERLFPQSDGYLHDDITNSYREAIIAMRKAGKAEEPLYPGAGKAIEALDDNGWLLGIATGKPHRGLVSSLEPYNLLERFVTLQTADRGPGKPSPEMLFRAMTETGVEKEHTVMIGDTTFDMEMARNAGIHAIGVAWGYHEVEELEAAGAHAVVQSFESLPEVVKALVEKEK